MLLFTGMITLDFAQVVAQTRATTQFALIGQGGSMETAYVKWTADSAAAADGYNVYYAEAGTSNYKKIDDQLIRKYSDYWRADVLGLAGGKSYTIKVVPVDGGTENTAKALVSPAIAVAKHVREGFAFDKGSTYKTASGAYNEDGTLKAGAQVVYVTAKTASTVKLDVVTSSTGTTTSCTGIGAILAARQKGLDTRPLAIRFVGQITASDMSGQLNSSGYLQVKGNSAYTNMNMTLEGVGDDATAYGWGILVRNCGNTEVRNMGMMLFPDDGISLDTANCNVWVHNNDLFYGTAGGDKDQAKGDGSIDVKKSKWITVSYNHFWESGKAMLLDASATSDVNSQSNYITYHHNWFDHSDSRHPRVRHATVHVYNNYYDGVAKYGIGVTTGGSIFVEANAFRGTTTPMMSSNQGTDALGEGTFSGERGGMIKAYNNQYDNSVKSLIYANSNAGTAAANATSFDAYLASARNEKVPSSYMALDGDSTYNNFDTESDFYSYTPTPVGQVVSHVTAYAGRMYGGDFDWTFTAAEDSSYAINSDLMAKIKAYKTQLVSVGGNGAGGGSTTESSGGGQESSSSSQTQESSSSGGSNVDITGSVTLNIQEDIKNFSSGQTYKGFTISGKLYTTYGSATVNGKTLSQCLKMESSTVVTFSCASPGTLKLVGASSDSKKNIIVDGVIYTANSSGVVEVPVTEGSHTIRKKDQMGVFYIALTTSGGGTGESEVPSESQTPSESETPSESQTPSGGHETLKGEGGTITQLSTYKDIQFKDAIYVSPTGKASGKGTKDDPMDFESALAVNRAGKNILMMEGTYGYDHQLTIGVGGIGAGYANKNNGSQSAYNVVRACDGAKVRLDFSSQPYNMSDTSLNARGLQLNADYWYFYNIEIYGAADNGVMVSGSHNIFERCVFDSNRDTGLQISRRDSSVTDYKDWPSYNLILNCTSKNNCDPATYENADGFASKLTCGDGNTFDGCISHNNSDDGWDLFAKTATGPIGVVTIRNCIAMRNGMTESGISESSCDGNGFKLGGSGVGTPHVVTNCLAIENIHHGFTDNNNPSAISVINCTAVNNNSGGGKNNFSLYRCKDAYAANCITYCTDNTADKYVNLMGSHLVLYNSSKWYQVTAEMAMDTGTSASRGTVTTAPASSDFVKVAAPAVGTNFHEAWRNPDGTINTQGVGVVSSTGKYAKFSTDGGAIGVRYSNAAAEVKTIGANVVELSGRIPGDVNDDGEVNSSDIVLLMQHLAEMSNLSVEPNLSNADVNGDGKADSSDAVLLSQYLAEMEVTLK